jgi:hypothetical protein
VRVTPAQYRVVGATEELPRAIDNRGGRFGIDSHAPLSDAQLEMRQCADGEPRRHRAGAAAADAVRDDGRIRVLVEAVGHVHVDEAGQERLLGPAETDHEIVIVVVLEQSTAMRTSRDVGPDQRRWGSEGVRAQRGRK